MPAARKSTDPKPADAESAAPASDAGAAVEAAAVETTKPRRTAKRAVKPEVAKKVVKKRVAAKAVKPTKPVKASKPTKPVKAPAVVDAAEAAAAAAPKAPKHKLVRDSFTIPRAEYLALDSLKKRLIQLARPAKKSEVLRAGIKLLAGLSDEALAQALSAVPEIKTGRPKKAK